MNKLPRYIALGSLLLVITEFQAISQTTGDSLILPVESSTISNHRLGLGLSLSLTSVRDRTISPLLYEGFSFPIGAGYRYVGRSHEHRVDIEFYHPLINSMMLDSRVTARSTFASWVFETSVAEQFDLDLRYSYIRDIAEIGDHSEISIIGMIEYDLLIRRYWFRRKESGDRTNADTRASEGHFGLHLGFQSKSRLDFGTVYVEVGGFLGGFSLRPDYGGIAREHEGARGFGWFTRQAHPASFLDLTVMDLSTRIEIPLIDGRIILSPGYSLRYQDFGDTESEMFRQGIDVGMEYAL